MLPRYLIVTAVNELPPYIYDLKRTTIPRLCTYVPYVPSIDSIDESCPADYKNKNHHCTSIQAHLSLVLRSKRCNLPTSQPAPFHFSIMHRYFALAVVLAASTWASASVEFEDGFVGELTARALLPNDDAIAPLRRRAPCSPGQYYTTRCRQCTAGSYCPDGQVRISAWGFCSRLTSPPSFHRIELLAELEHIPHPVHLCARFVHMGRSPRVRGLSSGLM